MRPSRRHVLQIGGGVLAGLVWPRPAFAAEPVEILMGGKADGSHVWFDPVGLHVEPGRTIRWINLDPGNSHTATAYHPKNFERPLRIPERAEPWNSDYLLPDESFSVTLPVEGVYDFFCVPHEHAGMVGRIIVGRPNAPSGGPAAQALPDLALRAFPSIDEIMQRGIIRRT
ncbi:plastocyanin/azurin family copper-binding protein [Microvirga sp. CF3016]|uniref:plastocyanin/azurin family copper-binding protein n=1 Tax=Microvirga sp. CF3016 TaxID=3110181 RepID=UPI002E7A81AA|nr:plastocyanin/azurin family copper-binding protein [Microvirga sp. CF3016]MEE1611278.1 plastocyanin/azurin family copper-binding protein [Microvirga sp. CF3016]